MGALLQENMGRGKRRVRAERRHIDPRSLRGTLRFHSVKCLHGRAGKYRPRRSVQIFPLYIAVFPRCVRRFRSGNWEESAVQKRLTIPLDRQPFFIHL